MADYIFDPNRAVLKGKDMFEPLNVQRTISLGEAVAQRRVSGETELLLLNHPRRPIALVKAEMAYHHVAQGEIEGEAWLVSF
ncbi:hypothetical protein GC175_04710 [bacterium]|nr:hypothetical protein [bacterium]